MESRKENRHSDAEWYCRKDSEEERFYEIFFQMCQKYGVRWASAEEKERQFIEEVTRALACPSVLFSNIAFLLLHFLCFKPAANMVPPMCQLSTGPSLTATAFPDIPCRAYCPWATRTPCACKLDRKSVV